MSITDAIQALEVKQASTRQKRMILLYEYLLIN